jgi:hypothetical protein
VIEHWLIIISVYADVSNNDYKSAAGILHMNKGENESICYIYLLSVGLIKYLWAFHATAMQVVHKRKLNSLSLMNS